MPDAPSPTDLVAHAGFVRSLARSCLGDDAAADDVAQDAFVRALERPPRERATLRSWFATVVRRTASNARRGGARRRRREEVVARAESLPSAADLAARAEVLESVAAAVRGLDPASRRLVLLRHYEGLPPREIAARTGEPVAAVRAGLARAHACVRTRLEQDDRGHVGGWRGALAGLVGLEPATKTGVPVGGGIAVTTATKTGAALAAAACLAGGVWWGATRHADPLPGPPGGAAAETARASPAPSPPALAGPSLAARATPPPGPAVAAPAAGSPPADVPAGWERRGIGRISLVVPKDWLERPGPTPGSATWARPDVPDARAIAFGVLPKEVLASWKDRGDSVASRDLLVDGRAARWEEFTRKDRAGAVVTFAGDDASLPAVVFALMGPRDAWATDRADLERILASVRVLPAPAAVGPGDADQEPSVAYLDSLAGSVTGPAVEGVVLRGSKPQAGTAVTLRLDAPGPPQGARSTITGDGGTFRFAEVGRGGYAIDVAGAGETGVTVRVSVIPETARPRVVVVLGTGAVEGFAYDRAGRPAAGMRIDAWAYSDKRRDSFGTVARADGSYRIDSLPAGTWPLGLYLPTGREFLADVRGASVDLRWGETKRVDLGSPTPEPTLRGRVHSAAGTPSVGPTAYLTFEFLGLPPGMLSAPLDAAGRFERRMPPGTYLGHVQGLAFARSHDFRVTLGAADAESDVGIEGAVLSGRVHDLATGRPAARGDWNALVVLEREAGGEPWTTGTAPDGTFAAFGVPAGTYRMHAEIGPPTARRTSEARRLDVVDGRDVADLRLDLPAK